MTEAENIVKKLKEIKPQLEREYFVKEMGIFGSVVRGEQTEKSDIDILFDFNRGMTFFKLVRLKEMLSNLFNKNVDIAIKTSLKPKIGKKILSEVVYI